MSYATVGACPKCGSPIYAESPWFGVTPPPSIPSCDCNPQPQTITTTGVGTGGDPKQNNG